MVSEFAEGGTLRKHLNCHFHNLTRKDKFKLGLEITSGLKHFGLLIYQANLPSLYSIRHSLPKTKFICLIVIHKLL